MDRKRTDQSACTISTGSGDHCPRQDPSRGTPAMRQSWTCTVSTVQYSQVRIMSVCQFATTRAQCSQRSYCSLEVCMGVRHHECSTSLTLRRFRSLTSCGSRLTCVELLLCNPEPVSRMTFAHPDQFRSHSDYCIDAFALHLSPIKASCLPPPHPLPSPSPPLLSPARM
jgi:hypothetical protein